MADLRLAARRAAKRYGLDPDIFERQINQESGFNPNARSPAGAAGVAQIMPDTARGWGVDPMDPIAALNAAAKNMASYVKKYGGYENALRAYNAGPGAIEKSKGYKETNNYVKVILGDQGDPGSSRVRDDVSSSRNVPGASKDAEGSSLFDVLRRYQQGTASTTAPTMGRAKNYGPTQADLDRTAQMVQDLIRKRNEPDISSTGGVTPRGPAGPVTASPVDKGAPKISELFWDPAGGWDEGKSIGAIGGHQHVHVAGRSKGLTRALLRRAQKMGLTVREHPDYDKVDPVHTAGSHHYSGRAADLSGSESAKRRYVDWVRRRYGLK